MAQSSADCDRTAPLGRPVLPEVYRIKPGASLSTLVSTWSRPGVAVERGLGGCVEAPLAAVAVLGRRRIEVRAARVTDDQQVAVGLAAGGDGPVHLTVVEDVDVVVDDHHALHVQVRAERGQD